MKSFHYGMGFAIIECVAIIKNAGFSQHSLCEAPQETNRKIQPH